MRPRHIHSDDRNMVKKNTRKRWMVIRCRSSSTQNFSQQTCCIDTICCHVPLMIDWIFISKRRDSLSFVALESTQSHVTTMNYLPCEPKPQNGWVLYQPCQRSHSTPWLTYMAQLLPGSAFWVDGSQVAPIFHVDVFFSIVQTYSSSRFSHFAPKTRGKTNALSLSDSKKTRPSSEGWTLHGFTRGKKWVKHVNNFTLEYTKKVPQVCYMHKTSFDSNPGKILRLATRLQHACTESCQALRAAKSHFWGLKIQQEKSQGGLAPYLSNTYTYIYNI